MQPIARRRAPPQLAGERGQHGVEAARLMGPDVQIVFVTAYEQYAVAAFEQGAIDYLVKPFDAERLGESVARLRRRVAERRRTGAGSRWCSTSS